MRTILLRSTLAVAVLAITWLFAGRRISMFLDHVKTVRVRTLTEKTWEYRSGTLRIADLLLPLGSNDLIKCDANNRVLLASGGRTFPLGPRTNLSQSPEPGVIEFTNDPSDRSSLNIEHSLLSWPTPFDFNFMTGHSPSWRRHMFYRVDWVKASGARLKLLWRYEQPFYPAFGWTSGTMVHEGDTGLIELDIRPSPSETAAIEYLQRTKGWKPADYRLEARSPGADGQSEVLRAVWLADERSPHPGGGQSIELHLDPSTHRVQREVGLQ